MASNDKPVMLQLTEGEKIQMIFEELRSAKFHIPTTFSTRVGTWPALKRHASSPKVATICQPAAAGDSEIHQHLSTPAVQPCNPRELSDVLEKNGPPSSPPGHEVSVTKYAGYNASLQKNGCGFDGYAERNRHLIEYVRAAGAGTSSNITQSPRAQRICKRLFRGGSMVLSA